MEQRFIKGDNLSFKEYLLVWNNPVCFHSLGKWFFFCTLKTIIICVPFVLIMLLFAFIAGSLPKDITEIVKFFSFIVLGLLGMVWCVSFCNAFIIPLVLRRRIPGFVNRYIPEAMDLVQFDTDVWFFSWKGHCFSISYKVNVTRYYRKNRPSKKVSSYYKISKASSYGDYLDWKTETKELPLLEGITIVYTNVNIFARIKLRKKFFPKEISEALEALLELDEVAFSF